MAKFKHGWQCRHSRSGGSPDAFLKQFAFYTESGEASGDTSYLVLGSVRKTDFSKSCVVCPAEVTPQKPWSATPMVARALQDELHKTCEAGTPGWPRLGPFKTRAEALRGLETWWLRRLGSE